MPPLFTAKALVRISTERIEDTILLIRGEKVILNADLAKLYGTSTKRLNEQVKRNQSRFPDDFMFQLTETEKAEVVANCDHLRSLKFSAHRPYAFTEHGVIMVANVLNSERAIEMSLQIVRAFVKLRQMLTSNTELAAKLTELESKYDQQFRVVFTAIRQLMTPSSSTTRPIGFRPKTTKK